MTKSEGKQKKKLFLKMASFAHLFWLHLGLTHGSHCHQSYSNSLAFMSATQWVHTQWVHTWKEKREHSSHQCSLMEGITLYKHTVKMKGHSNFWLWGLQYKLGSVWVRSAFSASASDPAIINSYPGCIAIWTGPALHMLNPEQVWQLSPVKK